jgi:hypothetical protein
MRKFEGVVARDEERFCGLGRDRIPLPFHVHTRILKCNA